ncbi:CDP-alcohol phosphatidyltransferase family protein [Halobacterium sp. CBA1126]|uniref:CDP-alcohol phosphatidyltransferase family protein n=1 Tax=Halobacterium sp. CBA1126 TaxID=2668074 RepID=UPI0012F89FEC|nr:CDP-alcohol phosphatidyltransferase family protein [Halobacterium sp. CBA1126]MUV61696.1 CDP-alcohol phosphatidyltransferase family protein [Halobacterium sp. CBA1126]
MTLDSYRDLATRLTRPWVRAAVKVGATPNAVSVVAFLFAVAAAAAFYGATPVLYAVGALCVVVNGWLDLLDGALARELGTDSVAGDLLDHVLDRYADVVVVAGLAAGIGRYDLGLAAVTGVLLTSYLGTQAQAVGLDRVYGGLLGRADRLALVGITGGLSVFVPAVGGFSLVAWLLALFAVVGHLTAVQRFVSAWRQLS